MSALQKRMVRSTYIVVFSVCFQLVSTAAGAEILSTSLTVELPADDVQFGGRNADVVNNNCLACHSADMILNQASLSQKTWEAEVHKMISVYKAPIEDSDISSIVGYLAGMRQTR